MKPGVSAAILLAALAPAGCGGRHPAATPMASVSHAAPAPRRYLKGKT